MFASNSAHILFQHRWTIIIGIVLCLTYSHFIAFKSVIVLDMEVYTDEVSFLRVYWADEGQEFSEQQSRKIRLGKNKTHYEFLIGGLGSIDRLRIDPLELRWRDDATEPVKLNGINITQTGYEDMVFQGQEGLKLLQPINGLEEIEYRNASLYMQTTNNDSQLLLPLSPFKSSFFPLVHLLNYILIMFAVALLRPCIPLIKENLVFVPVLLLAVLLLVLVMASTTNYNTHPDEFTQLYAVEHYSQHFLPPALDSAEIAHTFSDYGQTRLASFEIYYQIAGNFTRLLQPLNLAYYFDARLFSVFLLCVLLYLSIRFLAFRYFALPLLISPQVWYLFSYANSDSFALFISTVLVYQAACKESALNRFLQEPEPPWFWFGVVGFGLLIGTALLLKSNFYIIGLFLSLYLIWRLFCGDFPDRKQLTVRMTMLAVVAIALFGMRWGLDIAANGFDRSETFEQLRIEKAKPEFNPTTPLEESDVYLSLRDKGMPLDFVTKYLNWGDVLFATSFGSYGYTQYFGSDFYYTIARNLSIILLLSIIVLILIHGPKRDHYLLAIVLICASILMLSSLLASWIMNFQPQGRYMTPILPMAGVLLYHARQYIINGWTMMLIAGMWVLSIYSFMFVGLANVPKVAGPFT